MLHKVAHHNVSILVCFLLTISTAKANTSAPSQTVHSDSLADINQNFYQTAFDILEKSLEIMGMNEIDNIGGSVLNWRRASIYDLNVITGFLKNNTREFILFNQEQWRPKTTADEWNLLVSDSVFDSQTATGVTWGLNVAPTFFGAIKHKHSFNASAVNHIALRVSVCLKFVF